MNPAFSVYAAAYGGAALVLSLLDVLWLWLVVGRLYRAELGSLMRADVAMLPAVAFYLIYVAGIVVFAVMNFHCFRINMRFKRIVWIR